MAAPFRLEENGGSSATANALSLYHPPTPTRLFPSA